MSTHYQNPIMLTVVAATALTLTGAGCTPDTEEGSSSAAAPEPQAEEETKSVVSEPVSLAPAKELPKTVVTVNDQELSRAALDEEMAMFANAPQFANMPPAQKAAISKQMESRIVDRFINQTLLTTAAKAKDIAIADSEVDKTLAEIRESLPEGVTIETVMQQRNMKMKELRKDIKTDLKIRRLMEQETADVAVATDEDIAKHYEQNKAQFEEPETVHARHILAKVDPEADEATKAEKKAEIEGLHKKLVEGEAEFEALASEHSDCPSSQKGGDLGTFERGQMAPAFEEAAFKQDVDAIGPVIETQFGYHIIQVQEHTEAGQRSLEEAKDDIAEQLTQRGKQEAIQTYLAKLRDGANIVYGDGEKQ